MVGGHGAGLIVPTDRIYVFDTSVLRSFAVASRLELLERRYIGQTRITIEVHAELVEAVRHDPSLSDVLTAQWIPQAERSLAVDEIEKLRLRLGGRPRDRRHLGEAASIQLALERGWILASDDRDAIRVAHAEGVATIGTTAILRALVRAGELPAEAALALRNAMVAHGRWLPSIGLDDLR